MTILMHIKTFHYLSKFLIYLILILFAIPMILPLIWMLITSITPENIFYSQENLLFIPSEIRINNYYDALSILPFHKFFINTLIYSMSATFGSLLSCTVVAYGFARYEFSKRNLLFWILLCTMILPGIVFMVPMFLMFNYVGWIDTYYPLIIPTFFGLSAGTVLLLRQRIKTIPNIFFDVSKIEGFNFYQKLRYIILPEIYPILTTVGVLHFIGHWNDLMGPLIYINTFEKKTLTLGLTYFQSQFTTQITLMMAASLVVSIPTMIVFYLNQKKIIRGINLLGGFGR